MLASLNQLAETLVLHEEGKDYLAVCSFLSQVEDARRRNDPMDAARAYMLAAFASGTSSNVALFLFGCRLYQSVHYTQREMMSRRDAGSNYLVRWIKTPEQVGATLFSLARKYTPRICLN
jgi:hypothetical protein